MYINEHLLEIAPVLIRHRRKNEARKKRLYRRDNYKSAHNQRRESAYQSGVEILYQNGYEESYRNKCKYNGNRIKERERLIVLIKFNNGH